MSDMPVCLYDMECMSDDAFDGEAWDAEVGSTGCEDSESCEGWTEEG